MINLINSKTITANPTTIGDCFNAIKNAKNDWYDTSETQLKISDKIYLNKGSDNISINHSNGTKSSLSTIYSEYRMVITDDAIIFHTNSTKNIIIIGKTINLNGEESAGAIINSNGTWYIFTDKISSDKTSVRVSKFIVTSKTITQLLPVCSPDGEEYFKNVFFTFIRKSDDIGKTILNNENFYIYENIAIRYTTE